MDFNEILQDALGQSVVAPLLSLVILPVIYRLVGANKRERREQEQQSIRLIMDLERGLGDLSAAAPTPAERERYGQMRQELLGELRERTEKFFTGKRFRPKERYYLLPKPTGFFGGVWAVLAILYSALYLMMLVAVAIAAFNDLTKGEMDVSTLIGVIILMGLLFLPALLLRWFAFVSARTGADR